MSWPPTCCGPTASDYSIDRLTSEYAVTPYLTDGEAAGAEMAKFIPLCTSLEEKITEYGQEMLLTQVEQPLAEVLASMELIGFSLDVQGLEEFGRELDLQLAARAEEIYRLAGEQFNINSPMQLGVILFDRLGLPHGKKTQRAGPPTPMCWNPSGTSTPSSRAFWITASWPS